LESFPRVLSDQIAIAKKTAASTNAKEKFAVNDRPNASDANAQDFESEAPGVW
jgi:hypothetical protein